MICFCKCCLRKFQYIGSKIVYWSKVFLSKGMVLYFFQKGCYIRTGILVILRCNVISIVIVLTKNRAQEIWTNEKKLNSKQQFHYVILMTLSSGLRYDQERTWILVPSILKINYCEITSPFPILLISIVII